MGTQHSNEEAIRELAYQLWQHRDENSGTPEDDWYQAERLLLGTGDSAATPESQAVDESVKESFPASDAPASHLPDEPPSNAEDKWATAAGSSKRRKQRQ
jgi:hypothetical protein